MTRVPGRPLVYPKRKGQHWKSDRPIFHVPEERPLDAATFLEIIIARKNHKKERAPARAREAAR